MSHRVMPLTSYSLPYSLLTSHFWIALDCPSQIGTKKSTSYQVQLFSLRKTLKTVSSCAKATRAHTNRRATLAAIFNRVKTKGWLFISNSVSPC